MKFDQNKSQPELVPLEMQMVLLETHYGDFDPCTPLRRLYLSTLRGDTPINTLTDVLRHLGMGIYNGERAILALGEVLAFGAKKYAAWNWLTVEEERYWAAARRHLLQHSSGELYDPESGLPHLAHAACSLMFVWCLKKGVKEPK